MKEINDNIISFINNGLNIPKIEEITPINGNIYNLCGYDVEFINIRGAFAKILIYNPDETIKEGYAVSFMGVVGIGNSLKDAFNSSLIKFKNAYSDTERIDLFIMNNPDENKLMRYSTFLLWHRFLTLSCESGQIAFTNNNGYSMSDMYPIIDFLNRCKIEYKGYIINRIIKRYKK